MESQENLPEPGSQGDATYDVVVVGGGFSASSFALHLRRARPSTRVLLIERDPRFDRKVGEATIELSAYFLKEVLGLSDMLSREQLPKHGLRFWFTDKPGRGMEEMSEVGTRTVPALPSFQLDRALLDEHLLELARAAGAEVLRPARALEIEAGWPESRLVVEDEHGRRGVRARWVVDASGRQAFLARRWGLYERNVRHPTSAMWGRYKGVLDMDGHEIRGPDPERPRLPPIPAVRRLATNHFCGHGWWCWAIPLSNGDTSVGVVWNEDVFEPPPGESLRARFESFVRSRSGLGELLGRAELDGDDFKSRRHLAYCTRRYMDKGWALIGDAASFIDPFYSPGLDHDSISAIATAHLITEDLAGKLDEHALEAAIRTHDERFLRSYRRHFEALYDRKYEVMGDAELMAAAYFMDTTMYYVGVVRPAHARRDDLCLPVLGLSIPQARIAYAFLRFYNQRLARIARLRIETGTYGRRNLGWHRFGTSFDLNRGKARFFWGGCRLWLAAEVHAARLRLARALGLRRRPAPAPEPASPFLVTDEHAERT